MLEDEPVARDNFLFPLWLLEGKSGKRWCISLCFIAWQLQLASLMGCDFMRFRFEPNLFDDDEVQEEYYLSVGFFRRATSDSITDFDGPSCMIYKDLERSVYQEEGGTNCAIVSLAFSSTALLYFILAMFGVVRHKNRESYGLALVTTIAGLMMAWPQNFVTSDRCDVELYKFRWFEANSSFPQFEDFTECNYGVQGVCGLIACLVWISAGLLLLCNAHYTKTPVQLAKAEEIKKRAHLRSEYFDQDTYHNHRAIAREQKKLDQKTLNAIRITTMSASSEYKAAQKYQETEAEEKQESAQPDRGQDIVSNIEVPEGTDDKTRTVMVTNVADVGDASISDENEHVVGSGDEENTGLVKSDVLHLTMENSDNEKKAGVVAFQSTGEKSDDEEKAGVVESVAFQSTTEKYDDEEKAGVAKSDVFQSTIENFDAEDLKSVGSNLKTKSAVEGSTTPDQNFFDADDISLAGSQDQSILTGVSYSDTINATPAKQVPKNVKTLVNQSSTITLDKEIE